MVIFTKKFGQFKQWTGEKFGSTDKTQKPAEIKKLQHETRSRFDGIEAIRDSLNLYTKSLDDSKNSSLGELAQALSSQSQFHEDNEFGTLLVTFGDGISKLSNHQNSFADEIRIGLLMSLDALLNETKEFEKLRKKLKNRRLDYDANNNKLQKSKKEDPMLEENVKTTKFKYEETLQNLEEMMVSVNKKETELIDPFIGFMEAQIGFFHDCLKTSESIFKVLKEGKTDLKSIDFVAASFRREIEDENSWSDSKDDSDDDLDTSTSLSKKIVSTSVSNEANSSKHMLVRANYKFIAENSNEMSLNKGDVIKVMKQIDEGWWIGTCDGKTGMFPSNYVSRIDPSGNQENEAKESFDEVKKSVVQEAASKQGHSYLPKGAPISYIGRNTNNAKNNEGRHEVSNMSCGQCDCIDFNANVFKAGQCNNCFHKH